MIIGITGHQHRDGIDWTWVQTALLATMEEIRPAAAMSSLAAGTDQLFAAVALQLHLKHILVEPFEGYGELFEGDARRMYRFLGAASEVKRLGLQLSKEEAFFKAGQYVVDNTDALLAVWDGKPSEGLGGTADVIDYARNRQRSVIWLDPITQTVRHKGSAN